MVVVWVVGFLWVIRIYGWWAFGGCVMGGGFLVGD